jgi:hypothetical protein
VDLGGEGSHVSSGEDRGAHDQVVSECHVDIACLFGHRTHRGNVGLDVAVQLGVGQFRERLDLKALIGVFDVDGQQAVYVRIVDLDAVDLRLLVLAEKMDLVPKLSQGGSQVGVVDVAAGAPQHVAVEDQDAHRGRPTY